jgi:hypothetical protein
VYLEKDDLLAYALSILLLSAQMWMTCGQFDSLPDIAGEKDFLVPVLVVGDDVADISAIKGLSSAPLLYHSKWVNLYLGLFAYKYIRLPNMLRDYRERFYTGKSPPYSFMSSAISLCIKKLACLLMNDWQNVLRRKVYPRGNQWPNREVKMQRGFKSSTPCFSNLGY